MTGNTEGIAVYNKLGTSTDPSVIAYFKHFCSALEKYQSAYFSDFAEQIKKPLNNQKIYYMNWERNDWVVHLFHTPGS